MTRVLDFVAPRIAWPLWPRMIGIALLGAVIAGVYGIVHDQITYAIGPEYYTRLKFNQFKIRPEALPIWIHVAQVGFLATWWVGFFSAWFLARMAVPSWPGKRALVECLKGFAVIFAAALAAGVMGYLLGIVTHDFSSWNEECHLLRVKDVPAFVRVAYIHNAGYLGGLLGLIAALLLMRRAKRRLDA